MPQALGSLAGPALVAAAALLWATDAPFRYPLSVTMDPKVIVFYEHLAGCLGLAVWVIFRARRRVFQLSPSGYGLAVWVGAGGSGLATLLYTSSFSLISPTIAILLQKLQPVFAILIARFWLGERPSPRFFGWAALAIGAAAALSVPDLGQRWETESSWGIAEALLAALIWASATVAGKRLLAHHAPDVVTFWRYFFGLILLFGVLAVTELSGKEVAGLAEAPSGMTMLRLLYMSYVAGLLAMIVYYRGLSRTSASVATIAELVYPISAVLINAWFLQQTLNARQLAAAAVLLFSVARISASGAK